MHTGGKAWKDTPLIRSGLFGPVRLTRSSPIDAISLAIQTDEGSGRLSVRVLGVLSSALLLIMNVNLHATTITELRSKRSPSTSSRTRAARVTAT